MFPGCFSAAGGVGWLVKVSETVVSNAYSTLDSLCNETLLTANSCHKDLHSQAANPAAPLHQPGKPPRAPFIPPLVFHPLPPGAPLIPPLCFIHCPLVPPFTPPLCFIHCPLVPLFINPL